MRACVRPASLDIGHSASSVLFDPACTAAHWELCHVNMCVSLQYHAACLAPRSREEDRLFLERLGAKITSHHMMNRCVFSRDLNFLQTYTVCLLLLPVALLLGKMLKTTLCDDTEGNRISLLFLISVSSRKASVLEGRC